MLVELIETTAADGVSLHGAWYPVADGASATVPLDGIVCLHGTGSNFYANSLWHALLPLLRAWSVPVLLVNTRGHDGLTAARSAQGRRWMGAAMELVDDCRLDVAAWCDFMTGRGLKRVALLGHSLGAVKVIYALAHQAQPGVSAVLAVSPPRLSQSAFLKSPRKDGFLTEYEQMAALVDRGAGDTLVEVRYPLPYIVSAAGYVDKYGPDERYDLLKFVDRVPVPMLFCYGTAELNGMAFAGMPEALEERAQAGGAWRVAIIAGADHVYTASQAPLAATMEAWLRKL